MMYGGDFWDKGALTVYSNSTDGVEDGEPEVEDGPSISPKVITVAVMLSIFSIVGVIGNAVAFYIFFRRRNSSTSVVFILALAGTDFITCLITIPYTIVHELLRYRLVYDEACKAYMFLMTSTVPFSAYIMVGIALDRYFCICHPFLYAVTIPRAKVIILCTVIPAVTFGIISALAHGTYAYLEKYVDNNNHSNHEIIAMLYKHEENNSSPGFTLDSIYTISGSTIGDSSTANYTMLRYIYQGQECAQNNFVISEEFFRVYSKIHASGFVLAYFIVAVLYILIYKSIYTRRANKERNRKSDLYPPMAAGGKSEETQMSLLNGNGQTHGYLNNQQKLDYDQGCGARKCVVTARNDASSKMPTTTFLSPNEGHQNVEMKSLLPQIDDKTRSVSDYNINEHDININTHIDDPNDKLDGAQIPTNGIAADKLPQLTNGAKQNRNTEQEPILVNKSSSNEKDEKSDEEESCKTPLLQSSQTVDPLGSSASNNSNPHSPSAQDKENNTISTTSLRSTHNVMSRSCPSLSSSQENAISTTVTTDAKNSPRVSPTSTVSPAASPPTSLPIKITFNPAKGSAEAKPKTKHLQTDAQTNSIKRKRNSTLRNRNFVANIKTAFMLFIVTLVFTIAFFPALLMANKLIPLNLVVFYLYFIYNVANPFIYAFMNQTFREDLKRIVNVVCSR